MEKVAQNFGLLGIVIFEKLPKEIDRPLGKKSPNLVTLLMGFTWHGCF
jgi:hypothetical protein